jgi:sialate O-acetylesterase
MMAIKLAALFSDHMVLQRDIPVPVWGEATAGEKITVRFAGQAKSTKASAAGKWRVVLEPMAASSEPRQLSVEGTLKSAISKLVFTDVLVGEVWICSGQSNMELQLSAVNNGVEETAAANYANLRLFTVPCRTELQPSPDITGVWAPCTPDTAVTFSAVGYFFGREILRKTGLPIGLISASRGATIAEAWTSRDALETVPFLKRLVRDYHCHLKDPITTMQSKQIEWAEKYDRHMMPNAGEAEGWHQPGLADGNWDTMELPRSWQSAGHNYSGVFWFRREVDIPVGWEGRDLTLGLGPTDKSDVTYFNGVQVGSITMQQRPDAWSTPRVYTVPGHLVKAGRAVIAVRVYSNIYVGGFIGAPSQLRLIPAGGQESTPVSLAGLWRYRIEADFGLVLPPPALPPGPGNPNSPYMLFENMIRPLLPYAIRGAIWYQGEANADRAKEYRTLFPLMIRSWREAWKQGSSAKSPERAFPFLFVQLANFQLPPNQPGDSVWAELREAQAMTLTLPNTGMAVAIDIGEGNDIHPKNKQDVGIRLSLPALAGTYGFKGLVASGPVYKAMHREKDRIRLEFDHVAGGLIIRGGKLTAFAIAGKDKKFVWADAVVKGDGVEVSSPQVPKPVAVRYGWADNPPCTLYNASALPAVPFRTDKW